MRHELNFTNYLEYCVKYNTIGKTKYMLVEGGNQKSVVLKYLPKCMYPFARVDDAKK